MDEFLRAVVQTFVAIARQAMSVYLIGLVIIYFMLLLFGFNFWTFCLAHLTYIVLFRLMPINWSGR